MCQSNSISLSSSSSQNSAASASALTNVSHHCDSWPSLLTRSFGQYWCTCDLSCRLGLTCIRQLTELRVCVQTYGQCGSHTASYTRCQLSFVKPLILSYISLTVIVVVGLLSWRKLQMNLRLSNVISYRSRTMLQSQQPITSYNAAFPPSATGKHYIKTSFRWKGKKISTARHLVYYYSVTLVLTVLKPAHFKV